MSIGADQSWGCREGPEKWKSLQAQGRSTRRIWQRGAHASLRLTKRIELLTRRESDVERDPRKMKQPARAEGTMTDIMRDERGTPKIVDRTTFQTQLDALRVREKAHTHEGDAIAAARRRLPMVKADAATPLIGERGALTLLEAFEGRRMLLAYYFMWHAGHPAPDQCE